MALVAILLAVDVLAWWLVSRVGFTNSDHVTARRSWQGFAAITVGLLLLPVWWYPISAVVS